MLLPSRGLPLVLVAVSVVTTTLGFAQNDAVSSPQSQKPGPSDRGLLVIPQRGCEPWIGSSSLQGWMISSSA